MTTKPLDLAAVIAATEQEIETLTAQRSKAALAAFRKEPGAAAAFTATEGKLEAARRVLSQAESATLAFAREEEVAEVARTAAEQARLEKDRAEAEQALGKHMVQTEAQLQSLVEAVVVTLQASEVAYNCGVALGIHGRAGATGDRIVARIEHALRLGTNLVDFDYSMSPSGREPLSGEAPISHTPVAPAGPASGVYEEYEAHVAARHAQNGKSNDEVLVMGPA